MEKNNWKGWLYLLPASVFLGLFLVYPLIDVLTYSFEEGYNFASQTYFGTGLYNYHYVLRDPYFLQALKNTLLLVLITVPLSTGLAMLISVGLSSIQTAAGALPDRLLSSLRDQHAGGGSGVHDPFQADASTPTVLST